MVAGNTRARELDLGGRLLWPLYHLLGDPDDPENAAGTLRRFVTSQHVRDLRLIAGGAWMLGLVGFLLALFLALDQVVASALAKSAAGGSLPKAFHVAMVGLGRFLKLYAPALGVLGAIIAWAYQRASARLGVVDLFACEISTLCRVATVVDTAARFTDEYEAGWPEPAASPDSARAPAPAFSSTEDYFPVFGSNARDLQSLEARVVINITAFYTYMKAVRDMRRGLMGIAPSDGDRRPAPPGDPEPGSRRDSLRNLVYMLFLALESARQAIEDLVEFEPEQAERTIVVLLSELKAYGFLCARYADEGDVRRKRLLLRRRGYKAEVAACAATVREGLESPLPRLRRLWAPAEELLDELDARLQEALAQATAPPTPAS